MNRQETAKILAKSKAGIVTFYPLPNHIDAQPNKMFEYMAAGIAVICSDFPYWKEIIEDNNCGICVNPLDENEISNAINKLMSDSDLAKHMGENGKKLVTQKYNWDIEEKKLIQLYKELKNGKAKR